MRMLVVALLLGCSLAVSAADDEARVRAAIGASSIDDCKIEGNWAAADYNFGEYEVIAVLHRINGRWQVVRRLGGRGPLTPAAWRGMGMSDADIARFGFGTVPAAVRDALMGAAHAEELGGGLYSIATHGPKFFASTRSARRTTVWEYVGGKWSKIFAFQPSQKPDRIFAESGFSKYMQRRLIEGECAASGKY